MNNIPKIQLSKKAKYVSFACDIDFFSLFKKVERKFDTCFLFESLGEQSHTSRYSIIGFDPQHMIRAKENTLYFDDKKYEVENPYEALRQIVPQNIITRSYAGGLVGYLSYEAVNYFEPVLDVKVHDYFDQLMFGVYTDGFIYDKMTGEIFYFYYSQNRADVIKELLDSKERKETLNLCVKDLGMNTTKEEHAELFYQVKEDINAGLTFQCQIGLKSNYKITGDDILIYESLRKINPSPHMYYLKFEDKKIIGASPELLFRLRDGEIKSFPLAGTIKRGQDDTEDKQLARKLLNDPKEIAEHKMLVDLHRNDIGRVAEIGSVKVNHLMDVKRFSHVQHISSEITGLLK